MLVIPAIDLKEALPVRLEQGEADLAHRRVDVRLGHAATTRQTGEGLAEAVA